MILFAKKNQSPGIVKPLGSVIEADPDGHLYLYPTTAFFVFAL